MDGFFQNQKGQHTFLTRKGNSNNNILQNNRRTNIPNNNNNNNNGINLNNFQNQNEEQKLKQQQQLNNMFQKPYQFKFTNQLDNTNNNNINMNNNNNGLQGQSKLLNNNIDFTQNNNYPFINNNNNPISTLQNNNLNIPQQSQQKQIQVHQFIQEKPQQSQQQLIGSNQTSTYLKNNDQYMNVPTKQFQLKQYDNSQQQYFVQNPTTTSNNNQNSQPILNKPINVYNNIQSNIFGDIQQQRSNSPSKLNKIINDLQQENAMLKKNDKENQKQLREKDEKIFKLSLDNRQLQDQLKEYQNHITSLEEKMLQFKRQEEQKQQRRQRQREEAEMQRQYAYLLQIEQMEQQQNHNQQPNVDNMTYEELLNLQDQIGFVSKGMKEEDINKIKQIQYDKDRMQEICSMCSVCQCDFENQEIIKELNPCKHIYHHGCINQWLKNEKNCPVCKQIIQVS